MLILLCGIAIQSYSQDIHFSQFQASELIVNPAFAGARNCDHCFTGQLRNQWNNVPVDYLTFAGSYDRKFYPKKEKAKYHWGGGLQFFHDIAGYSRLKSTSIALIGTYVRAIKKRHQVSFGLQLGGTQRAFQTDDLNFDDQWEPYKLGIRSTTEETFANQSILFGDAALGVNWTYHIPEKRTTLNFGVASYHLNRPKESFYNGATVRLYRRYAVTAMGLFQLTKKLDIIAQVLNQNQGPHHEIIGGLYLRGHLNQRPTKELALQLGIHFRTKDEINPAIGILWKQWETGLSYDINISDFDTATKKNGGPEVYVKYCIKPPPELNPCPTCPKRL